MAGMIDFLRALAAQQAPAQGVPFNQLVSGAAPMQQQIAQTDNLSPLEQYLAKQGMGGFVYPDDGYETSRQVNVGAKTSKGDIQEPYPNTDDNTFFANGPEERIIRAKRALRDGLKGPLNGR